MNCERIGYCPQQSSIDQFIKTSKLLEVLMVKISWNLIISYRFTVCCRDSHWMIAKISLKPSLKDLKSVSIKMSKV